MSYADLFWNCGLEYELMLFIILLQASWSKSMSFPFLNILLISEFEGDDPPAAAGVWIRHGKGF